MKVSETQREGAEGRSEAGAGSRISQASYGLRTVGSCPKAIRGLRDLAPAGDSV